jgi:hypothetical protein
MGPSRLEGFDVGCLLACAVVVWRVPEVAGGSCCAPVAQPASSVVVINRGLRGMCRVDFRLFGYLVSVALATIAFRSSVGAEKEEVETARSKLEISTMKRRWAFDNSLNGGGQELVVG